MTTFIIILLTIAYTIGLVSLTVQLICYFKDIEYRETLLLSLSFILLIITLNIKELNINEPPTNWILLAESLFMLILGSAVAFNMHAERETTNQMFRNKVLLFSTLGATIALLVLFIFKKIDLAQGIVNVFLTAAVIYSMLLTFFTKPSLLIKHREEKEKKAAKLILILIGVYVILGTLNSYYSFLQNSLFDGPVLISVIFIFLAISKLIDDIERLGLFANKPESTSEKLNQLAISAREKDVVHLLLQGLTYQEIAERLFISMPTVKSHVTNSYKKLGVRNKVELMNLLLAEPKI